MLRHMQARHKTTHWDILILVLGMGIIFFFGFSSAFELNEVISSILLIILANLGVSRFHKLAGSYVDLLGLTISGLIYHGTLVDSPFFTISYLLAIFTRLFTHLFDNELDKKHIFSFIVIVLFAASQLVEPLYFIPWSRTPIPLTLTEEIILICCTYALVFSQVFNLAYTLQTERRNLNKKNHSLSVRYNQIIEIYQVLNHNLKTPLANALSKVEIALLTKDTSRLQETKESMNSALEKLNTITLVKKIVAQTNRLDEFLKEWQIAFNHQDIVINTNTGKAQSIQIIEESGIALALALDIFAQNSKEAGADVIEISLENKDSSIMVCFRDNGPGLDEKRLELFGQIQQSSKGSSGLGTYLAVRLLNTASIELYYFNRPSGGFEVQMAL